MNTNLAKIPEQLRSIPNWVNWRSVNKGGENSKVPFIPGTTKHASSTDSSTWVDFDTAVKNSAFNNTEGVGFVIGGKAIEEQIVGFDLDGCRNPKSGELTDWAEKILECLDSYTEVTPSGLGVRVWVIGKLPGDNRVFNLDPAAGFGNKVKIEVYDRARYFTVTGDSICDEPCPIETRDLTEVYKLCSDFKKQFPAALAKAPKINAAGPTHTSIARAGTVVTNKLELLMHGRVISQQPFIIEDGLGNSLEYPSHSEADMALCTQLALKRGNNPEAITADFENSALYRKKWDRSDYRDGTISKAIETADGIKSELQPQLQPSPSASATETANPVPLWDRATSFFQIEDTPMEWIIPGLIVKGESTMMTGDFGSFKSYMTYFIADAISEGGTFVRRTAQKHPVLVLDRENSKSTISLRRYLVGNLRDKTNARLLGRFTTPSAPEITNAELLDLCKTVHPFVIIDSMQDFHPGKKENDTDDMTQFSIELNRLIDAGAVGVLIIHHVPKSGNGKAGKYRGTTAIPGGVGGALFVQKTGRTNVKIEGFKTRDGEDSIIELLLKFPSEAESNSKTGRVTYTIVQGGIDRSSELKEAVLSYVQQHATKGLSKNKIAKGVGGDRNEIYGLVNSLLQETNLVETKEGITLSDTQAASRGSVVL